MQYILRLHRYDMRDFLFPGEENAFTHVHSGAKLCLLPSEQGYVLEVSYLTLEMVDGEPVRKDVVDQYLLTPNKTIEVNAVYPRYSKGSETAIFDFKAKLLPVDSKEVKKYAKGGASHAWLADLAELMGDEEKAEKERRRAEKERQDRIAYNKAHPNYSGMDPDVMKDYMMGESKDD